MWGTSWARCVEAVVGGPLVSHGACGRAHGRSSCAHLEAPRAASLALGATRLEGAHPECENRAEDALGGVRGVAQARKRWRAVAMAEKAATLAGGAMSVQLVHKGYDGPPVSIPKLGLGVYQVPPRDALHATAQALKFGYRHIDSAALYRNEQAVGRAVRESGIPREQIFVTTKVWNSDQGYQDTLRAFDRSLNQLGIGYVDLYLVHSPMPAQKRLDTWKAMEEILKSGRAKAIGVSNYGVHHLKELFANCKIRPSVNQIQLHPFGTHEELVKFCENEGIVLEAYSPLTQGRRLNDRTLVQIAKEHNKSPAQVLIRWCLQKNFVVLPKSVTPHRILENSQVFDFNISEANMAKLDGLDEGWYCGWDPTLDR